MCTFLFLAVSATSAQENNANAVSTPATPTFQLLQEPANASVERQLDQSSCQAPNSSWSQIAGPESARIQQSGLGASVIISEKGLYRFELNCCSVDSGDPIQSLMSSPSLVGYGGKTTGGANATSLTRVTTLSDSGPGSLREALTAVGSRWIVFDEAIHGETIYLESNVNVHSSDFTIDGSGANITISPAKNERYPLLTLRGGNGIIHDLTIDGRGFDAAAIAIRQGKNYWIDHVTIHGNYYLNAIGIGQNSKGEDSATDVTISNYHAYDTNYAILGGGVNTPREHPPYRVTIHSSNLEAFDRNPFIKNYGTAHMFNNYIHSHRYAGIVSGMNSVVMSEGNVISARNANNPKVSVTGRTDNEQPAGTVYSVNDLYLDVASWAGQVEFHDFNPLTLPYKYKALSSTDVVEYVLEHAGAGNADNSDSRCFSIIEEFSYSG